MIEMKLVNRGLELAKEEQSLKNQLKKVREEIDIFFKDLPEEDMFELLLTWKDCYESIQIVNQKVGVNLSDYEYESTDGSGVTLLAIRIHEDNIPEVRRLLGEFGRTVIEDNRGGIIIWESNSVVAPMDASFNSYILIAKEPRTCDKIIINYSPSLFQIRYRKKTI